MNWNVEEDFMTPADYAYICVQQNEFCLYTDEFNFY